MSKKAISITVHGNFNKTESFLKSVDGQKYISLLDKYGQKGVAALAAATPIRTGKTAKSWKYRIINTKKNSRIEWYNTNVHKYINIALILQYGHSTYRGGYVTGIDYINPALKPLFDELADKAWKEVTGT